MVGELGEDSSMSSPSPMISERSDLNDIEDMGCRVGFEAICAEQCDPVSSRSIGNAERFTER